MVNHSFELLKIHPSGVRVGQLTLGHGVVPTPHFMPIATRGAIKSLTMDQVRSLQPGIILGNTYHLFLRPGLEVIQAAGGLHPFLGWSGNMLTDSGGFQIFSLAQLVQRDADGVTFRSHIDGSLVRMTPEQSMEIQTILNPDIAMCFDWFPGYPASRQQVEESVQQTTTWALRSKQAFRGKGLLFGIVQGGMYADVRHKAVRELLAIDFPGYAVGGLAVGEPFAERQHVLQTTLPLLPSDKPRYVMGLGLPEDLLAAVRAGADLFDCVIPTREARHGKLYIGGQVNTQLTYVDYHTINMSSYAYRLDQSPIDPACTCSTCKSQVTRSYLRHLFSVEEPTALTLASIHNLHFYLNLMRNIRQLASDDLG